jgi:hypothetical protein
VLQAALQDALAARGLDWSLAGGSGRVTARVRAPGDGLPRTAEVTTYSEGMALLWAYLDALAEDTPAHRA